MFFAPKYGVGLVYGHDEITLVCLSRQGRRVSLVHRLSGALTAIQDEICFWARPMKHPLPTGIAISQAQCFRKIIQLTHRLSAEECESELRENLANYLPGIDASLVFDFQFLQRKKQAHVFLTATRQSLLHQMIDLCKATNLFLQVVDIDVDAKVRLAHTMAGKDQHVMCLDQVEQNIQLCVSHHHEPVSIHLCASIDEVVEQCKVYFAKEPVKKYFIYLTTQMQHHDAFLKNTLQQPVYLLAPFNSELCTSAYLSACGLALRVLSL